MAVSRQESTFYRKYVYNLLTVYKNRQDVKAFLEILLSLVTVAAFGLLALRPTVLTIASLITDINAKKEVLARLDQKIQNLSQAQAAIAQQQSVLGLLDTAVPTNPTPDTYIRQIEGLATKYGIVLEGLDFSKIFLVGEDPNAQNPASPNSTPRPGLPSGASAIEAEITASGAYQNLLSFQRDVEKLRRPINIDSISFATNTNTIEDTQQLLLTIRGRIPYLKQQE